MCSGENHTNSSHDVSDYKDCIPAAMQSVPPVSAAMTAVTIAECSRSHRIRCSLLALNVTLSLIKLSTPNASVVTLRLSVLLRPYSTIHRVVEIHPSLLCFDHST